MKLSCDRLMGLALMIHLSWGMAATAAQLPTPKGESQPVAIPTLVTQTATTKVTGVKLTPTDKGIDIAIETESGTTLGVPTTSTQDKTTDTDLPNAVLTLPDGKEFRAANPATGIANISVIQVTPTSVRVTIVGSEGVPTAQISTTDRGLTISSTPVEPTAQAGNEPEIEINVVGLRNQRGYKLPNATTATKTDTPIKDVPQSIQIVPPEVLRDRKVRSIAEGVETVSGVVENGKYFNGTNDYLNIRGFTVSKTLRNGLPENAGDTPISTIPAIVVDRIEVLKGPSSVVSGAIEPGGIINYVTKKPLREPSYKIGFEAGSFGRYQPSIDLSGSLTADNNVLYRLIGAYERRENIQKFGNSEITSLAPSVSVKLGDHTDLDLNFEYSRYYANPFISGVPVLADGSLPDRSIYPGYPNFNEVEGSDRRAGYVLTHNFNENLQIRNNFAVANTSYEIKSGEVKGLGFGLGLFYVGNRQGDLENTFALGDYLRTDAAVYYRRDRFNAAINIRNLLNTNYISSSSGRTYVDRGEPFTVVGSVGWEF